MTPTPLDFESDGGPLTCDDGVDNDADSLVDCDDPDCAQVFPCQKLAPVVSPTSLPLLIVLLGLVGLFGVVRAARQTALGGPGGVR